jgi:peptidoglycan/xylan/chitin deacetylase (PgdA/CDA1 family)
MRKTGLIITNKVNMLGYATLNFTYLKNNYNNVFDKLRMKQITLMFHDIVVDDDFDASGFPGTGSLSYKISAHDFQEFIRLIESTISHAPAVVGQDVEDRQCPVYLTFDDGGKGAMQAAEILDRRNWKAHFFITTDYIGERGFVTSSDIIDLHKAGHVIGSHSCDHTPRMSLCPYDDILTQWRESKAKLEDILGVSVQAASLPNGYYSKKVAQAASQTGIRYLFTSEPVANTWNVSDCQVFGRYAIWQKTNPIVATDIANGKFPPRLKQYVNWNAKKIAKITLGKFYLQIRSAIIDRV